MKYAELRQRALVLSSKGLTDIKFGCSTVGSAKTFIESHIAILDGFEQRKKKGDRMNWHTVNAYYDRLKKFVLENE